MKISADRARCLVYEQYDPDEELTFDHQELLENRRWNSVHLLVARDKQDRYWMTRYQQGLTESQDERAFEDDSEVEFREARRVPVITYTYEPA